MNTVKMKMVFPPAMDTIQMVNDSLSVLTPEQADSAFATGARPQMGFNREQQVYMRHIAPYYGAGEEDLNEPKRKPANQETPVEETADPDKKPKKRWFWNRNKKADEPAPEEESLPIDQLKDF